MPPARTSPTMMRSRIHTERRRISWLIVTSSSPPSVLALLRLQADQVGNLPDLQFRRILDGDHPLPLGYVSGQRVEEGRFYRSWCRR